MTRRTSFFIVIAMIAIGLSALCDAFVARTMRKSGAEHFVRTHKWVRESLKAGGSAPVVVAGAIIAFCHRARWRASLFLLLADVPASINQVLKWVVGRTRPYKIDDTIERLAPFELHPLHLGDNLCFPSGHASLAFATAAALGMLWPRLRWLWYVLAGAVAIERFAENAHWLSDTVAGAALGIGSAYCVAWLLKSWKINPLTSRS